MDRYSIWLIEFYFSGSEKWDNREEKTWYGSPYNMVISYINRNQFWNGMDYVYTAQAQINWLPIDIAFTSSNF